MSVLAEIVRNVLVIIIIASFLELLLPAGTIRPFVRFAIGLFVLIAVLNPVLEYISHDNKYQVNLWDYTIDEELGENIIADGKEINESIFNQNKQIYKEKLEGQISAVVLLIPGVEDVMTLADIEDDGTINRIEFTIIPQKAAEDEAAGDIVIFSDEVDANSAAGREQVEKKVLNIVTNMYGLDAADIDINFEGG